MDGLCLNTGIHGVTPSISVAGSSGLDFRPNASYLSAGSIRDRKSTSTAAASSSSPPSSRFSFRYPWWTGRGQSRGRINAVVATGGEESVLVGNAEDGDGGTVEERDQNWVMKILHVRSLWKEGESDSKGEDHEVDENSAANDDDEEVCCVVENGEDEIEFDRDSFSRLLRKASLAEAKLYAQMSYLGNLAYCIPKIKPGNLMKYGSLKLITSSIEKRELAKKAQVPAEAQEHEEEEQIPKEESKPEPENNEGQHYINASNAYQIAASAASYLHSQAKCILPFDSGKAIETDEATLKDSQAAASLMATTDSVTAVVAAKEEVKQAVADDLSSTCSSPCEWFICDDDQHTRYIVIQGSESLESWQANLLFEPIEFEGLGVPVHRGIYEAAKGIYEQMLPKIRTHLKSYGRRATFRFTGHSLGGSLSVLINLMLLIRDEVPASSLLPVITFGSPSIMCGGDQLLSKLGLLRNHVQAITMHRDIVPRAFSCSYPSHVAELLKAVNSNFRNHPCLNNQSVLYAPMGELVILQPDSKFSPQHDLLPSETGLFFLTSTNDDHNDDHNDNLLRAAQSTFMNTPHPLEILSDRSAYGSEGAIQRDHDMHSYLKSVRNIIRLEMNRIRKARREHRRKFWWSRLGVTDVFVVGSNRSTTMSRNTGQMMNFSGAIRTGRESIKRFSRMVASQHMHLFVVMLLPARLILLGVYNVVGFR